MGSLLGRLPAGCVAVGPSVRPQAFLQDNPSKSTEVVAQRDERLLACSLPSVSKRRAQFGHLDLQMASSLSNCGAGITDSITQRM